MKLKLCEILEKVQKHERIIMNPGKAITYITFIKVKAVTFGKTNYKILKMSFSLKYFQNKYRAI